MTESADGIQRRRGNGRPFAQGHSGNPAGKPKGARNHTTMAVEAMLEGEAQAITRKAIEMAKVGDTIALRLCMERVAPLRRGRPVLFDLPVVEKASDLAKALGGILRATASGALTPDEAATIAGVLETKRRAIETGELEQRLDQLEQRLTTGAGRS